MDAPGEPLLLAGGAVWNGATFDRRDVLIGGNRIEAIVLPGEVFGSDVTRIDATDCAILPPFFDGHVHSSSTLLRGTENGFPLELWSYWAIAYGQGATRDSVRAALRLTATEMIRGGVGGYIDHFPAVPFTADAIEVHRESGLRIGFAPFFGDICDEDLLNIPLDREVIGAVAPMAVTDHSRLEEWAGELARIADDRMTLLLGPNAPQRCSPALLDLWAKLARRYGLGSHTHLLETYPQLEATRTRWPHGVLTELDRLGLLGDKLSLAHAIWLDQPARNLVAERGAVAIHNPVSNAMLGSGQMPVRDVLSSGVRLGLGTDCSNTSGRHDMFETMRRMLVSGREAGSDHRDWVRPEEALAAASENGWLALARGPAVLEPGAPADLITIDFGALVLAGAAMSANSIVSHGEPAAIRDLMVDGRWLMKDRRIMVFDEGAVIAEAKRHAKDLRRGTQIGRERLSDLINDYQRWSETMFSRAACPYCDGIHVARP